MTDRHKRVCAMILLHSSDLPSPTAMSEEHGAARSDRILATELRREAWSELLGADTDDHWYRDSCLEAAYRLIETSPKLRREFFGRGAR